jgi:CBS domain-containing protein
MRVEALMSRDVKTCGPKSSLSDAARLMWDGDCGCLPVVDEGNHAIGMITDRDVCMAAYTQGAPLERIPVAVAMSKKVFSCRPGDTVGEAETIMRVNRVRRLPVLDGDGRVAGVLSLNDLAREVEREGTRKGKKEIGTDEVVLTLGAICQPRGSREITAGA